MPKRPVSSNLYDLDYYEKYNHGYEEFTKNKGLMPELESKIKNIDFKGKRVLDLACGRGEFVRYAALKGAYSYGMDYSEASIQISKKTVADLPKEVLKNINLRVMDAKKLDYNNDYFDYVVLFDIVEHLHDWELNKCLSEVKRVLKPGGRVYIHTSPNRYMMTIVRFVASLFGITLKSSEFHVNEQTYFSMIDYTRIFAGKVTLEKDKKYWSKQMVYRGTYLKYFAFLLDKIVDFKPVHLLLSIYPFSVLSCTDIWFIGKKK